MASKRTHTQHVGGIRKLPDDEELKLLEKIVLGTGSEIFEEESHSEDDSDEDTSSKRQKIAKAKKPAWVDEDDDVTFSKILKKQRKPRAGVSNWKQHQEVVLEKKHQQMMGTPKWSKQSTKSDTPADNLLNRCGNFLKKSKYLNKDELEFEKVKDLNHETYREGPKITVVKFHPKSTVAMVAGASGLVSVFQVDGQKNSKLQSFQFNKYPIDCGSFLKNGEEILLGSQHFKYFYSHNLMTGQSMKVDSSKMVGITQTKNFCVSPNDDIFAVCGNNGTIYLFAVTTKEFIDTLQMNCNVTALDFSQNGSFLYSHGEDGEVYIWDVKSRMCIKKFYDDGCLKGTSIAISSNDQLIACGSSSGVVNVYDLSSINSETNLLPTKTIYNLVTPITNVKFNSTCEILAISSNYKDNAVRLVHCPTMTVFANFPEIKSKMRKPMCFDFSPNSGYFVVGDHKSSAHLFRLKYFGNY